jgi:hypothetical protein
MSDTALHNRGKLSSNALLWASWVAASTAAILLSFVILYLSIFLAKAVVPGVNEDRVFGYLMFPVLAALLGIMQWLVLRKRMARAGWWVAATAGGLLVGIAAAGGFAQVAGRVLGRDYYVGEMGLPFNAIVGLSLGLAQAPVLRRHIRGWFLWVLITVLGYLALGLVMGVSMDPIADMVAVGAIPAAFSGLALLWLWRAEGGNGASSPNVAAS